MLMVERKPYKRCLELRKNVCPTFADVVSDAEAIARLPDGGVPDAIASSATHMPEATNVKTTFQGPASRMPTDCQAAKDDSAVESEVDAEQELDADAAGNTDASSGVTQPARDEELCAEVANQCETIIGIDQASDPEPVKYFQAMQAKLQILNAEAAKIAQTALKPNEAERATSAAAAMEQTTCVAVDLQHVMKKLMRGEAGPAWRRC